MDTSTRKRQLRALRFALAMVLVAFATLATAGDALGLMRSTGQIRLGSTLLAQEISAENLGGSNYACKDNEWHFIINQIDGAAPTSIHVEWSDGTSEDIALTAFNNKTAHYATTNLHTGSVTVATTTIYDGWDGNFVLSHVPCGEPTSTPTVVVPTDTPTVVVPTDTPTVVVPTDTPTEVVPTDTPTEVVPTDTPTEVVPTDTPTTVVVTNTPTTPAETPTTPAETPTTPAETPTTPANTPTNTATTTVVTEVPSETATVAGVTEVPSPTASVEETVAGVSNVPDSGIGTAFGGNGGGLGSILIMLALAMAAGLFGWRLRPADIRR
jgi:hypothetical protein